jgi:hypothetical protein
MTDKPPRLGISRRVVLGSLAALALASSGCEDKGKASEEAASSAIEFATSLVDRDIGQIRKGMPLGVPILEKRLPDDLLGSRKEVQEAIKAARSNVDDLAFAKSTFFSFAAADGVVLRSETDPDRFVEQNALKAFPALARALEPKAGPVEAFGELDALRGVKRGHDLAWIVAAAARAPDGTPRGLFLTGWSLRYYVRSVQEQVRAHLAEKAKEAGRKAPPLVYAFLLKGNLAYGDPDVPDVTGETLVKLEVQSKAQSGPFSMNATIEQRAFGIAARALPAYGSDAAVAVVASVY